MYNSSSLGIKQCDGLKMFKRELKEYILNSTIFLVILIDTIISLFCYVLHFFAFCMFVFLFLYFTVLFSVLCIFYFVFENS